jgi:hypothetical protein
MPSYIEGMTQAPPTPSLRDASQIDAEFAEHARCPRCGVRLNYQGWFGGGAYRAFMICACGYEKEF